MSLSIITQLEQNPSLFKGKKILVIGDIALDRSFRCRHPQPGVHAKHGAETIFDIEIDDFGTLGSANNTCLFCKSLGAESTLVTVIGIDEEGKRAEKILRRQKQNNRCLQVKGLKTVTRFRFFVYNDALGGYELVYRADKEPDYDLSYASTKELFNQPEFLDFLRVEIESSDGLLINDRGKGLLSPEVLKIIGEIVRIVNADRKTKSRRPLITLVDPKNDWKKFLGFPVDVLTPNETEASGAVGLQPLDVGIRENLEYLARELYKQYGQYFQRIVVTLGRHGSALLDVGLESAKLYGFKAIPPGPSQYHVATHCGDMFASALLIGLACGEDMDAAITFANYVGSLQFAMLTGTNVTRDELLRETNRNRLRQHFQPRESIVEIADEKEGVCRQVLADIKNLIDYKTARYRNSDLIAARPFSLELDKLGNLIRPGGIVYIDGESGSGKGAILANISVFVAGYQQELDCYNAHAVLDTTGKLEEAIRRAEERKTCIVLDEVQNTSDSGITKLLTAFPQQDFGKQFSLICAGHYDHNRESLRDLRFRSSYFEVLPYRREIRRHDLPFLIAQILRGRTSSPQVLRITALALRELLRCDYDSAISKNWRALKKVLEESCKLVTGDTLDWEHVNLDSIGIEKARNEPVIQGLKYVIEIAA